jgi:hypothetical protein
MLFSYDYDFDCVFFSCDMLVRHHAEVGRLSFKACKASSSTASRAPGEDASFSTAFAASSSKTEVAFPLRTSAASPPNASALSSSRASRASGGDALGQNLEKAIELSLLATTLPGHLVCANSSTLSIICRAICSNIRENKPRDDFDDLKLKSLSS